MRPNQKQIRKTFVYLLMLTLPGLFATGVLAEEKGATAFQPDAETEIWVLAGQSNMVGCGKRTKEFEPDPRIWLFNMDNSWIPAVPPIHRIFESVAPVHRHIFWETDQMSEEDFLKRGATSKRSPLGGIGPGFFFAKHLLESIDSKVGLVASAHGGTTMKQWDPSLKTKGDDSLYGATLDRVERVGGNIAGILWYQGESEGMEPDAIPTYEENFLRLIDSFREDTGIEDLPFILVQIGRWAVGNDPRGPSWESAREIQRLMPHQRKNVFMTSAIDLPLDDQIHLSMAGHERLGARLAEIALSNVYGKEDHASPIDLVGATVENSESIRPLIHVKFEGVNGRLNSLGRPTGFEIRSMNGERAVPQPYAIEFDPENPSMLLLRLGKPLPLPAQLIYGPGLDPYVNIVDEKDMPIPAFTCMIDGK
ncbi:MAG: sialate O-acetylesterase [Candidatus Omnitrophica bacterium]|nr:sialate O-acetylesterase [Candidatus Omnitrophota bacterium]